MLKRQDTIERDVVVFEFTKNSKPPAKPEPTLIEEVRISYVEISIYNMNGPLCIFRSNPWSKKSPN